jgi:hypothetical protein
MRSAHRVRTFRDRVFAAHAEEREHAAAEVFVDMPAVREDCFTDLQVVAVEDVHDVVRELLFRERGELADVRVQHRQRHLGARRGAVLFGAGEADVVGVEDQSPRAHRALNLCLAGQADVVGEAETAGELDLGGVARGEIALPFHDQHAARRAARVAAADVRVRDVRVERGVEERLAGERVEILVAADLAHERDARGTIERHFGRRRAPRGAAGDERNVAGEEGHARCAAARDGDGVAHLHRRLEAQGRLFGERPAHDVADRLRDVDVAQRLRLVLQHAIEHGVQRVGVEGFAVGEQFVEDGAEGEDVGAGVGFLPFDLLGRHVVRRAEDHARAGHVGLLHACEAEVVDLHLPVGEEKDVCRLEIAMDDAALVREGDGLADLLHDAQAGVELGQAVRGDDAFEVVAVEQLHGHEEAPVVLAEIVHDDDVRMGEPRGGLRLAQKALALVLIARGDDFEGDVAVEHRIVRAEDFSHRAMADALDEAVFADCLIHDRSV